MKHPMLVMRWRLINEVGKYNPNSLLQRTTSVINKKLFATAVVSWSTNSLPRLLLRYSLFITYPAIFGTAGRIQLIPLS